MNGSSRRQRSNDYYQDELMRGGENFGESQIFAFLAACYLRALRINNEVASAEILLEESDNLPFDSENDYFLEDA